MVRVVRPLALLLAAAALGGCSAAGPTAEDTRRAAAQAELQRAITAIHLGGTGTFGVKVVRTAGGEERDRLVRGAYDLRTGRYGYHVSDREPTWVWADLVGADDGRRWVHFTDRRFSPANGQRWAGFETIRSSEDAALLPVLAAVQAESMVPRPREGHVVTGRMPAREAALLLRTGRQVEAGDIPDEALRGTATVRVRTAGDGRPTWFEFDGADVRFDAPDGLPASFRQRVRQTSFSMTIGVGDEADIELPERRGARVSKV